MGDEVYKTVPGRGLNTQKAIDLRKKYLKDLGLEINEIEKTEISKENIHKNIESLVGSTEIPLGIIGPLKYNSNQGSEEVFCLGGTLEGALISSMNRGAKAISLSGGFSARVMHQRMVRAPLFIFSNKNEASHFENWIKENFNSIKERAESYSNHAKLLDIELIKIGLSLHTKFSYSTGDAAGQNMTTTCTWHAIQWALENFKKEKQIEPTHFTLEGNGASDKKVSQYLLDHGRGIKVIAECTIHEAVMRKVLRTSTADFMKFNDATRQIASRDGMLGYNTNVANAIAAIFVATGQDLASIHESSLADLKFSESKAGLKVELTLFSLVIGTVGGGTHLPKQNQALKIMGCDGSNKVNRFAELIAGFALGLEISTCAALESGEFAKAHEKLGRNKPADWISWNEINEDFIKDIIKPYFKQKIENIDILKGGLDNGILMNISRKVNSKILGFIPLDVNTSEGPIELVIKSKALDIELIKGLHLMAASINPDLSDELSKHKYHLEYQGSHYKELVISKSLYKNGFKYGPAFYGDYENDEREIYLLIQERFHSKDMLLLDSENQTELWTKEHINSTIDAIAEIHSFYINNPNELDALRLNDIHIATAKSFYNKIIEIIREEYSETKFECLATYLEDISGSSARNKFRKTLVHNDFNPRNVAIRNNGDICIYDWELAVKHYPQRDIVEFLSFVLKKDFTKKELFQYLNYYFELSQKSHPDTSWGDWKRMYVQCIKEYLITRVSFYKAAEILMKLKFVDCVFDNCTKMIQFLEND